MLADKNHINLVYIECVYSSYKDGLVAYIYEIGGEKICWIGALEGGTKMNWRTGEEWRFWNDY